MSGLLNFIKLNKEWLLSGIGVVCIGAMCSIIKHIIRTNKKQKGKLKISFTFKQAREQSILGLSPVFPLYSFEIVNVGNIDIQIKDVLIYFCGKKIDTPYGIADGLTQMDKTNPKKYQVLLTPKQVLKGDFEISSLLSVIKNQLSPNASIKLKVIDTLGNKYFSKKSKYKNFLTNAEISNTLNLKK